jgi:hypothetical protein
VISSWRLPPWVEHMSDVMPLRKCYGRDCHIQSSSRQSFESMAVMAADPGRTDVGTNKKLCSSSQVPGGVGAGQRAGGGGQVGCGHGAV